MQSCTVASDNNADQLEEVIEADTVRLLMEDHVHLHASYLHNNKVENRSAPIITWEDNQIW